MVGERTKFGGRVYGHPGGLRTPELLDVPWAVIDGNTRKEIVDEGVNSSGSVDSEIFEDRLRALGYTN